MKRILAAAMAFLLLTFAGCGAEKPDSYPVEIEGPQQTSAPAQQQEENGPSAEPAKPGWQYGPSKEIEITESLAAYAPAINNGGEWHRELALFQQEGKTGVIDMKGNVVVPAQEDVHWCPVCGITNQDETKIFDEKGEVIGAGGHDLGGGMPLYDPSRNEIYRDSYGFLTSWDDVYVGSADNFIAQVVSITAAQDPNTAIYEMADSGERVDVGEVTGYMLFMPDGTKLDGVVYEQLEYGKEDTFAAKNGGSWGFVHAVTGQQLVGFRYKSVLPFHQGLAAVEAEDGWTYVNKQDTQKTVTFEKATSAHNGRAWVKTAEGWGVIKLDDWLAS